ncbi:hypothetical protein, partial [Mesorhizobium sp. M7A.F.Ca.CA.001.08.2.1]|uniref:hypothetical protein n=1 Tax=Mesorhizobium sp. M7A.F.Ca.CA.001.08.2.1 TaxID=2496692 RepID=UPI0019D28DC3
YTRRAAFQPRSFRVQFGDIDTVIHFHTFPSRPGVARHGHFSQLLWDAYAIRSFRQFFRTVEYCF